MVRVGASCRQDVAEHRCRFFERDAMSGKVLRSLAWIPFEAYSRLLHLIRRPTPFGRNHPETVTQRASQYSRDGGHGQEQRYPRGASARCGVPWYGRRQCDADSRAHCEAALSRRRIKRIMPGPCEHAASHAAREPSPRSHQPPSRSAHSRGAPVRYFGSGARRTTILPRLSPEKRPRKALGAFSMPSTTVSFRLMRPALSQPPTSPTNSP
jgi:hypothetical protein